MRAGWSSMRSTAFSSGFQTTFSAAASEARASAEPAKTRSSRNDLPVSVADVFGLHIGNGANDQAHAERSQVAETVRRGKLLLGVLDHGFLHRVDASGQRSSHFVKVAVVAVGLIGLRGQGAVEHRNVFILHDGQLVFGLAAAAPDGRLVS